VLAVQVPEVTQVLGLHPNALCVPQQVQVLEILGQEQEALVQEQGVPEHQVLATQE